MNDDPHEFPLPLETAPMEARLVAELPAEPGWQFEPKWDGFRCLAFRTGDTVELRAKSGKPLTRYFPEMAGVLRRTGPARFVLDGELVIPIGETFSFDALQARLHPAESRVRKLAAETPAALILFDLLAGPDGESLLQWPLAARRTALEALYTVIGGHPPLRLSPATRDRDRAHAWLEAGGGALDGVVAKRLDAPYLRGERAMLKVKQSRSVDCVVGGFRYQHGTRKVGSLLLGLYSAEGRLDHVGFTATLHNLDRAALTRQLERLVAPPGFSGRAPGGPSRWATERSGEWQPLRPELVVEVGFDQVTGERFRHGTKLLRWRPDKAPSQCTFEQLRLPSRLSLATELLEPPSGRPPTARAQAPGAAGNARGRRSSPSAT